MPFCFLKVSPGDIFESFEHFVLTIFEHRESFIKGHNPYPFPYPFELLWIPEVQYRSQQPIAHVAKLARSDF